MVGHSLFAGKFSVDHIFTNLIKSTHYCHACGLGSYFTIVFLSVIRKEPGNAFEMWQMNLRNLCVIWAKCYTPAYTGNPQDCTLVSIRTAPVFRGLILKYHGILPRHYHYQCVEIRVEARCSRRSTVYLQGEPCGI